MFDHFYNGLQNPFYPFYIDRKLTMLENEVNEFVVEFVVVDALDNEPNEEDEPDEEIEQDEAMIYA